MLSLAGLLSGAVQPVAVSAPNLAALPAPEGISAADWRDLQDERDADNAEFAALAGGETTIRPHDRRH